MTKDVIVLEDQEFFYGKLPYRIEVDKKQAEKWLKVFPAPEFPVVENITDFSSLADGSRVNNLVVIASDFELKRATNGNLYLEFLCSNAKGSFKGKIWDKNGNIHTTKEVLEENPIIKFSGKVNQFPKKTGKKSFDVDKYEFIQEEVTPFHLIPSTPYSVRDLSIELGYYVSTMAKDKQTLIQKFLIKYWREYCLKPAAKGKHHAFLGGLIQHKVEMLRFAELMLKDDQIEENMKRLIRIMNEQHLEELDELAEDENGSIYKCKWNDLLEHMKQIYLGFKEARKSHSFDKDRLKISILMHDIGKVYEYTHTGEQNKMSLLFPYASDLEEYEENMRSAVSGIKMDNKGSLIGHIPLGTMMVNDFFKESGLSIAIEEVTEYLHCISSHHGKLEWGSPVKPVLPSAFLLHFIDNLDARYMSEY